ncbi:hypothetical protein [Candidatus Uabimicrobium amorphum]|uniref:Uncharacterized protein n=1 Tax=Uabimicrobium amorphum TaxID=2596890 RepID=A0A5S9IHV0_UABAM|nr:hypothetical protein [Candidatus Uabimicrobium amorphum]BBM82098.1 hypothetical protein UABAM_00441 [Candidatus Uabimicrobium amorphum]
MAKHRLDILFDLSNIESNGLRWNERREAKLQIYQQNGADLSTYYG